MSKIEVIFIPDNYLVTSTKLTFSALALRRSEWRNCGLCVGLYGESGATLLVGT